MEAQEVMDTAFVYMPYLKGMTIYRASSKENEPLVAIPNTPENIVQYMGLQDEVGVGVGEACSLAGGACGA
jgi:hypothetical protein